MKLYYRQYSGSGEPVIILHGLFGNQANWSWHARELADSFSVYSLDLRNHGRSPWSDKNSYRDLALDVLETMRELGLDRAHFIGHSMGGKTAMQVAFLEPAKVNKLVIADIAPVDYPPGPYPPLLGMQAINLSDLKSRTQADEILKGFVQSKAIRDFLLTNLQRGKDGSFHWRCNLEVLAGHYPEIRGSPDPLGVFPGPALFVKGGNSDYILPSQKERILALFPRAQLKTIENAGHWVHSEKPQPFIKIVRDFLSYSDIT